MVLSAVDANQTDAVAAEVGDPVGPRRQRGAHAQGDLLHRLGLAVEEGRLAAERPHEPVALRIAGGIARVWPILGAQELHGYQRRAVGLKQLHLVLAPRQDDVPAGQQVRDEEERALSS